MNQLHPDTQYEVHRSFQKERLARALQEKPVSESRSFNVSKLLVFIGFLAAGIGSYTMFF